MLRAIYFTGAIAITTLNLLGLAAHAAEQDIQSKIVRVQVFPSGAEITRVAKTKLDTGDHTIVLGDLPAQAIPGSIRVEGNATGTLRIGSVDSRRLFVARDDALRVAGERQSLEDKIENLKDELSVLKGRIDAAQAQRTLITNLSNLPSRPPQPVTTSPGPQTEDWPQLLAFIGTSMSDISQAILNSKVKIRKLSREIKDLEKKLSELVPRRQERTEVKVFVNAGTPLDADLIVRYQVPRASWSPFYDARLATGSKTVAPKLELTRRAVISQHSGENWDDVEITLSTTRPKAGSSAPKLHPVTVDYQPEYKPQSMAAAPAPRRDRMGGIADGLAAVEEAESDKEFRAEKPKLKRVRAVAQAAGSTNAPFQAVFKVPGRVSVASTGEAKRIQIETGEIEPVLSIKTVPKRAPKAYLVATLKLPKGSPLLPGPVSLFRDGTFVGTSRLPLLAAEEEHELGFGVDDLVRVRHRVVTDNRGETGLISSSRTQTRGYLITLKNLHERAIAFTVEDQIPTSKQKDIRVERTGKTAPTKTNVDDKRGILAWTGTLKPDQEYAIEFGYRVTWPGSRQIRYGR